MNPINYTAIKLMPQSWSESKERAQQDNLSLLAAACQRNNIKFTQAKLGLNNLMLRLSKAANSDSLDRDLLQTACFMLAGMGLNANETNRILINTLILSKPKSGLGSEKTTKINWFWYGAKGNLTHSLHNFINNRCQQTSLSAEKTKLKVEISQLAQAMIYSCLAYSHYQSEYHLQAFDLIKPLLKSTSIIYYSEVARICNHCLHSGLPLAEKLELGGLLLQHPRLRGDSLRYGAKGSIVEYLTRLGFKLGVAAKELESQHSFAVAADLYTQAATHYQKDYLSHEANFLQFQAQIMYRRAGEQLLAKGEVAAAAKMYWHGGKTKLAHELWEQSAQELSRHHHFMSAYEVYAYLGDQQQAQAMLIKAGDYYAGLKQYLTAACCYEKAQQYPKLAAMYSLAKDYVRAAQTYSQLGRHEQCGKMYLRAEEFQLAAANFLLARHFSRAELAYAKAGLYTQAIFCAAVLNRYDNIEFYYAQLKDSDKPKELLRNASNANYIFRLADRLDLLASFYSHSTNPSHLEESIFLWQRLGQHQQAEAVAQKLSQLD